MRQFDENPVGTGPYILSERDEARVRFQANPNYRHYREDYPAIREIAFNRREPSESLAEFEEGTLHFVYDLLPEHAAQLSQQGRQVVKLQTPSVYYLCLNYQVPELKNVDLRLAMAHAIDRKMILDTYFRKGGQSADHAALNGPFPPGSWACDPKTPEYNTAQSATFLTKAKDSIKANNLHWPLDLTLLYPDRDPAAERACQEIKTQIGQLGVELRLTPVAPDEFYDRVVNQQKFDLVYWRHDFQDETFWIWPMLDPKDQQPGGGNFMGYYPDQDLADLFNKLKTHKAFTQIRQIMRDIHHTMSRSAVVIPLWRLDTYVAVNPRLNKPKMDPLAPLERAETWRLEQP